MKPGIMAAALLAYPGMNGLLARERTVRSTADVRERPTDELDRPRYRERSTHRGFEVRTNKFFVVANTRVEDARWAAEQMEIAWADFGRLADAWMNVHHHSDFGIGDVQVYIDGNAPKDRNLPLPTLNVVGIQTQMTLHVGQGGPGLEEQLYRLRKAAGLAFLHTAELDRQLPPWTCDGLAAYVAVQRLSEDDIKSAKENQAAHGSPRLGGEQWRLKRGEQDRLEEKAVDPNTVEEEVRFLLIANDAEHAPAFLAAIRDSIAASNLRQAQENMVSARRGEEQPAPLSSLDVLAVKLSPGMDVWRKAPLRGQPILEIDQSSPEELKRGEREMAVVLKLARRFSSQETPAVHTRITAFDRERGFTVLSKPTPIGPAPLGEWYQRMVGPGNVLWGTLDAEGNLVLSNNHEALRQILGVEENRYRWETADGRTMLTTEIDRKWKLQGWLEENAEDASRPLAKFAVTKTAVRR